jgi:hypothetical protein
MSIDQLPIAPMSSETRYAAGAAASGQPVINLQEIKSILYLGLRGNIPLPAAESHRVDTYA